MDEKRREEMKKYAGPTQPSMLRRSDEHDYSSQCFYLITLTTEGRRPLLGQLTGKANAPDGSAEAPRIVLTELGLAVAQEWSAISSKFPQVAVIAQQVMPDHFHGILYFREHTDFHLGRIINGFKVGCNRAYKRIVLGLSEKEAATMAPARQAPARQIPAAAKPQPTEKEQAPKGIPAPYPGPSGPPVTTAAPPVVTSGPPVVTSGPPAAPAAPSPWVAAVPPQQQEKEKGLLWSRKYNDRILHSYHSLDRWKNYLHDNPRRLAFRREHPDMFRVRFGIEVAGQSYAAIGNQFLLSIPQKLQVQCSRSMTDTDIQAATAHFLAEAKKGSVLVSPAISKGEQQVMRAALDARQPLIFLTPWGFNTFSRPGHQYYDACCEGRFLILAPWPHQNRRIPLSRNMCLNLNSMAKAICEY